MRILVVTSGEYDSAYGGGLVYVRRLVAGLVKEGHAVAVLSMVGGSGMKDPKEILQEQREGVTFRSVRFRWYRSNRSVLLQLNSGVLEAAREAVRDFRPDCVHANGWKATFARACYDERVPIVITAHYGGIVCPVGNLLNADDEICVEAAEYNLCLKCSLRKHPVSSPWQGVLGALPRRSLTKMGAGLENFPKIPFVSFALKQPHHVAQHLARIEALRDYGHAFVAPSKAIGRALVRNGIDNDCVSVLHHGIQPYDKRPFESELGQRPVRFGYVGRINRVKGYHVMIEAFSRLIPGKAELHVIGDTHSKWDKQYLRDVRKKWPVFGITHHGHVSGTALAEKMAACDVIVLPTICLEVFGLVVPEAFSIGRPVIISKCGGPEELVRDGVDGLIVDRNDPAALAEAMQSLVKDPFRIKTMAQSIGPVYTMAEHIKALEDIYKTAMNADKWNRTP